MPMALRCSAQHPLSGRRYTFKLSRDPQFPEVPAAPGFPSQPSCITTRSSAIVCGTGNALTIRPLSRPDYRLSLDNRSLGHFLPSAVSASPNALCHVAGDRLGRKKESHLLAPIAAAPALLEACGYSACSIPSWRLGIYRDGSSVCLLRRCVFCRWRSAL